MSKPPNEILEGGEGRMYSIPESVLGLLQIQVLLMIPDNDYPSDEIRIQAHRQAKAIEHALLILGIDSPAEPNRFEASLDENGLPQLKPSPGRLVFGQEAASMDRDQLVMAYNALRIRTEVLGAHLREYQEWAEARGMTFDNLTGGQAEIN